jgi:hypothetical protein
VTTVPRGKAAWATRIVSAGIRPIALGCRLIGYLLNNSLNAVLKLAQKAVPLEFADSIYVS